MKRIKINGNDYSIVKQYKNGFVQESVIERCKETDYFDDYDYILGDWAYDKLRLKGFYDKNSPTCNENNSYENIDEYIKKYCAYECRYFVLKKVSKKDE